MREGGWGSVKEVVGGRGSEAGGGRMSEGDGKRGRGCVRVSEG